MESRLELGLPLRRRRTGGVWRILFASAVVLSFAYLAGHIGGELFRKHYLLGALQTRVVAALRAPDSTRFAVRMREAQEADLPGLPAASHVLMAHLYLGAADWLADRPLYLQEARLEVEQGISLLSQEMVGGIFGGGGEDVRLLRMLFEVFVLDAMISLEQHRDVDALKSLRHAESALAHLRPLVMESERLGLQESYDNALAYLQASSTVERVHDGEEALALAKRLIVMSPHNSLNPAYLDTLAESYHATGNSSLAVSVQRRALALATSPGLWVYIQHFDEYRASAPTTPNRNTPQESFVLGSVRDQFVVQRVREQP